ncbi:hypothetical protein E5288_WYG022058 [Bos mutus]|uniref:PPM-type phosphatase domain-containing protein n=6 Tax=Boreoeutheria TaxID=1437010 RepID=A0A6B0RVN9_9CETA|nr:hypothetical protein [Bos mutus]
MLTRVKSAVANFMGGIMAGSSGSEHGSGGCGGSDLPLRFPYGRPEFLGLSQDEVECSADHIARPILILKETRRLPWATGYAELKNRVFYLFWRIPKAISSFKLLEAKYNGRFISDVKCPTASINSSLKVIRGVQSHCYWVKRHIPSSSPYNPFKLLDTQLLSFHVTKALKYGGCDCIKDGRLKVIIQGIFGPSIQIGCGGEGVEKIAVLQGAAWNAGHIVLCNVRTLQWSRVINAGKSTHNEDQASCEVLTVKKKAGAITSTPNRNSAKRRSSLPNGEGLQLKENSESEGVSCHYWSLFDGHAGSGAAVVASRLLQHHITEQLQDIVEILKNSAVLPPACLGEEPDHTPSSSRTLTRAASLRGGVGAPGSPSTPPTRFFTEKKIPHECLVIGALESAFKEMDLQIERERSLYNISGGCTALTVVCLLGKLYVANAGDSRKFITESNTHFMLEKKDILTRAIIIRNGEIIPMSSEFTPETERQRLQYLAFMQPHLLGNEFTHLEFPRRVQRKELGKKMLYRDFNMTGWAYKTIEDDDLKFPLIYGEGKKARVMATIGVTRGLGDHDLKVHDSNIYIKPFLSSAPEVRVYDLSKYEHGADDVLILATDGLWDVLSNEEVAEAITQFLPNCDPDDPHRYTLAAQDLVMRARGVLKDRGWRISNDRLGSGDDISVYVIPLIHGNKLS